MLIFRLEQSSEARQVRSTLFAFFAVFLAQFSLAALNHGILVLAPIITKSAGLRAEAVGIIGGLSGFGAIWCYAANSAILPYIGPLKALFWGCLVGSVAAIMFTFTLGWIGFFAALAVGFGHAIITPAGSIILTDNTPKKLWGTIFSLRMAGVPAGGAFAGLVAATIITEYDWRLSLYILLCPSILTIYYLKLTKNEISLPSIKGAFALKTIFNPRLLFIPFKVVPTVRNLEKITFVSFGFAAVQGCVFTFFTTYLTMSVGFSLSVAGALYATVQIFSFFGRIMMGIFDDLLGSPRILFAFLGFCSPIGLIILVSLTPDSSKILLHFKCALVGLLIASWNGLVLAEISRISASSDIGENIAASTFFTFISYMVIPPIFGVVVHSFGYNFAFTFVGLLASLSSLTMLLFTVNASK